MWWVGVVSGRALRKKGISDMVGDCYYEPRPLFFESDVVPKRSILFGWWLKICVASPPVCIRLGLLDQNT